MTLQGLVTIVLVLAICGFGWYLLERFVPMPAVVRQIIIAVVVIAAIVWLLQLVGINVLNGVHR